MANAAQRQRKLAAKAARRKAVVAGKKKLEVSSTSLIGRIRVASKGPFVRCLMSSTLFDIGIGHIVVARLLPSGLLGCAFFLVDVFCLGIKDVFYVEMGENELRSRLAEQFDVQRLIEIEPARARKLIRDATFYAAGLGLSAAKDTSAIEAIFGDRCLRLLRYLYIRQGRQALLHQRAERHAGTHPCHHPSSGKEPWYRKEPRYWLLGLPGQTRAQPYRTVLVGRFTEDK